MWTGHHEKQMDLGSGRRPCVRQLDVPHRPRHRLVNPKYIQCGA